MKKSYLSVFIFLISLSLIAENISGPFVGSLGLSESMNTKVNFKPEEIISIHNDTELPFLSGVELEIVLPASFLEYRNSFGLYFYKQITPTPSEETVMYQGKQVFMRFLPMQKSVFIQIPLIEEHSLVQDAITIVFPSLIPDSDYPLLFTLLPIMKGIPDKAMGTDLTMQIKPIYEAKGKLLIYFENYQNRAEEGVNVKINEKEYPFERETAITLESGLHKLLIDNSLLGSYETTVAIEPGKTTEITHVFEYIAPILNVNIPEEAEFWLDGELILLPEDKMLQISAGSHQIQMYWMDMVLEKNFTAVMGEKLEISFSAELKMENH